MVINVKDNKKSLTHILKKHNFLILFSVTFFCMLIFMGYDYVMKSVIAGDRENKDIISDDYVSDNDSSPENPISDDNKMPEETGSTDEAEQEDFFEQVELSYLDDAVFIGDSRTLLLKEYAHWENVNFYVGTGYNIWGIMDSEIKLENGRKTTVRNALAQNKFKKVYIQLGINELGTGTAVSFTEQYARVLEEIKSLQPDAIIFLQSIMHVSEKQDEKQTYINNAAVDERNEELKKLADNESIFWLDANSVFDDEDTGKLNAEYTSDGIHLKAGCVAAWQEYLLSHGINRK